MTGACAKTQDFTKEIGGGMILCEGFDSTTGSSFPRGVVGEGTESSKGVGVANQAKREMVVQGVYCSTRYVISLLYPQKSL